MDRIVAHTRGFLQLGSSLGKIECFVAYLLPLGYALSDAAELKRLLLWNAACQFAIFITIVQIPLALTQKMAYVDIGWPLGLLVLGVNGMCFGHGAAFRRYIICGCMMVHGARMFCGKNPRTCFTLSK